MITEQLREAQETLEEMASENNTPNEEVNMLRGGISV